MLIRDRLHITTQREYTDEGFLKVPARISRVGTQQYLAIEMDLSDRDPYDKITVYRPKEEVFNADSLASFVNKPVTNDHPPVLVDSSNFKEYAVGFSGGAIIQDGLFVKADQLVISDKEAIEAVESGKVELSNGYTCDIEWTPGMTEDGEHYDAIQRNIRGNHIAIVKKGRAGSQCRVADNSPTNEYEGIMRKITIDGVDYEVSESAAQAVSKLQKQLSDAEEKAKSKEDELAEKEDEMAEKEEESKKTEDSLQARLDDALSKMPTSEAIDKLVADRSAFIDSVRKVEAEYDFVGKDEDTIRKEIVSKHCSNVQLDSVSGDYIKARFDILVETADANPQATLDNEFRKQVKDNDSNVDNRPADVIAREKMMNDSRNQWKKGSK